VRSTILCFVWLAGAVSGQVPGPATDQVRGELIVFNDNGAWCWYQDPRALVDNATGTLLIGSVAASEGPDGARRAGNVELTTYRLRDGERRRFVLHENLQVDDHDTAALHVRPDGRYLAMYTKHKSDHFSRWRISLKPHDASAWGEEQTYDWSARTAQFRVTYSNLHYLAAEGRLYNFVRAVNDDPSILISRDHGGTWSYAGKLLTEKKVGYVNGYTRYASNGTDRIDFITTEHHPRDFNNSIYHGYIQAGRLHRSDGTVVDDNVFDDDGRSATQLSPVFAANSVFDGETMTHAWTADLRLDRNGNPVAIVTCRANDVPENSNFNDHRFFYCRFDGGAWRVRPLAKAGPRLWPAEQDYTGLGALDPQNPSALYVSTPIDPRTGSRLEHHEIFEGVTADDGAAWRWTPITWNSTVDNLRPIVPRWDAAHTGVLWFRGAMQRSQHYDTAVVGTIESRAEQAGRIRQPPAP
jgi:hypothetical protein